MPAARIPFTHGTAPPRRARRASLRRRNPLPRRLALRVQVAVRHDALDRALAAGADPRASAALAIRAAQLERPAHRRALARALRRIVAEASADAAAQAQRARIPIVRGQVRDDAGAVLALAERLDCPHPADAPGIAIARRLVVDGLTSPVYTPCEPHTLGRLSKLAVAQMAATD